MCSGSDIEVAALAMCAPSHARESRSCQQSGGQPVGRYFFCCLWSSDVGSQHRHWSDASGLATPPENLLQRLAVVTLPAGTNIIVGVIADNFPNELGVQRSGGNTQIFVPEVKTSLFREYRLAEGDPAASDVVVLMDNDGILRFRQAAGN